MITLLNSIKLIIFEIWYMILYVTIEQLFFISKVPSSSKTSKHNPDDIFIIPGYCGSGYYLLKLQTELTLAGYNTYILRLPNPVGSFDKNRDYIVNYIQNTNSQKPILLGHSMGGILALQSSNALNSIGIPSKCMTICTPYSGTWTALLFVFTLAGRKLLPNSSVIKGLRGIIPDYNIAAPVDQVIIPFSNSLCLNAIDNSIVSPVSGHLSCIQSSIGIQSIIEVVKKKLIQEVHS